MAYKTIEELKNDILFQIKYLAVIPDDFPVKDCYLLGGISQSAFAEAFKQYKELFIKIHKDAEQNPEEYGFIQTNPKNGKTEINSYGSPICPLLRNLSLNSEYKDGKLCLDSGRFPVGEYDKILLRLRSMGFVIDNNVITTLENPQIQ